MPATLDKPSNRLSAAPKFARWEKSLRQDIAGGRLQPRTRLPSFVQLQREHGLSRPTVERVYNLLENDGLIERRNGSGVYVGQPQTRTPKTGLIGLVSQGLQSEHRSPIWVHLLDALRVASEREEKRIVLLESASRPRWN